MFITLAAASIAAAMPEGFEVRGVLEGVTAT
jgi:hypothetical protein